MDSVAAGGAVNEVIGLLEFSRRVRIPLDTLLAAINARTFTKDDGLVLGDNAVSVDFRIWRSRYPVKRIGRNRKRRGKANGN
jgi:hypothetical protein